MFLYILCYTHPDQIQCKGYLLPRRWIQWHWRSLQQPTQEDTHMPMCRQWNSGIVLFLQIQTQKIKKYSKQIVALKYSYVIKVYTEMYRNYAYISATQIKNNPIELRWNLWCSVHFIKSKKQCIPDWSQLYVKFMHEKEMLKQFSLWVCIYFTVKVPIYFPH